MVGTRQTTEWETGRRAAGEVVLPQLLEEELSSSRRRSGGYLSDIETTATEVCDLERYIVAARHHGGNTQVNLTVGWSANIGQPILTIQYWRFNIGDSILVIQYWRFNIGD